MIENKSMLAYSGLTYYDERIKDYINNTVGGSALHPGAHIFIDSANTISAVYDSSDFDISGLTDSQNLRETWSNKQDALSAGTGITIDANNVISVNENEIAEIDDTVTETNKTWSSSKISGELEGKSNTGHTHDQYSLKGHTHEQYSLTSHTHTISDTSDLQDALDSKSNTGHTHDQYSLTSHTHSEYSLTSHTHTAAEVGALPSSTTIPTTTNQLTNDSGFITGFTETDPTVPAWAKAENKPTYDVSEISGLTEELACKSDTGHTHEQYSLTSHTHNEYSLTSHTHTAAEVGALPDTTNIPNKTSDLTNDSGFITGYTLPIASSNALGGVKINGNNLSISNDGTLSATDTTYSASDFDIKDLSDATGLRNTWSGKQDVIDDLNTIRSGATLGATALQLVPSEYITDTELGTALLDYYTTGDTYTKTEVNNLIHSSEKFHYEIYANLSGVTDPKDNVLYLIGPSGTGSDKYEEYVYANNAFTKIGDTTIDLTGYATITALTNGLAAKSDTGHTHSQYSLTSHTHTEYSLTSHTHDQYSLTSHTHTAQDIGALPSSTTIPSTTSQLTNDSGFITGFTETDPTVPAWAKESTKPTYSVSEISGLTEELTCKSDTGHTHEQYSLTSHTHTAAEVGALPDTTSIPNKTSDLTNDSGFITGFTETDPTVPAWAKAENKPTYDVSEISGLNEKLTTKVESLTVTTIWSGTQQEYDDLQSHDSNTLYIIK